MIMIMIMLNRPKDLPNKAGFAFVGVRKDGSLAQCVVKLNIETHRYIVTGEARYEDLIGWKPKA